MSRSGWVMLTIGYAVFVLFTAMVVVAWVDMSTEESLSIPAALAIAAGVVALGGVVQVFLFARLRRLYNG